MPAMPSASSADVARPARRGRVRRGLVAGRPSLSHAGRRLPTPSRSLVMPPATAACSPRDAARQLASPPASSTCLRLLVEGQSDREIGEALFIGTRTVQTHVANLFAKLGVNARAEAAAVAVRRGLV